DSVLAEIQTRGLTVHMVRHPILDVRRNGDGTLLQLAGDRQNWQDGRQESLIVVLLPALDEATRADLAKAIENVLAHVRVAVNDWRPMRDRLAREIGALEQQKGNVPDDLLSET